MHVQAFATKQDHFTHAMAYTNHACRSGTCLLYEEKDVFVCIQCGNIHICCGTEECPYAIHDEADDEIICAVSGMSVKRFPSESSFGVTMKYQDEEDDEIVHAAGRERRRYAKMRGETARDMVRMVIDNPDERSDEILDCDADEDGHNRLVTGPDSRLERIYKRHRVVGRLDESTSFVSSDTRAAVLRGDDTRAPRPADHSHPREEHHDTKGESGDVEKALTLTSDSPFDIPQTSLSDATSASVPPPSSSPPSRPLSSFMLPNWDMSARKRPLPPGEDDTPSSSLSTTGTHAATADLSFPTPLRPPSSVFIAATSDPRSSPATETTSLSDERDDDSTRQMRADSIRKRIVGPWHHLPPEPKKQKTERRPRCPPPDKSTLENMGQACKRVAAQLCHQLIVGCKPRDGEPERVRLSLETEIRKHVAARVFTCAVNLWPVFLPLIITSVMPHLAAFKEWNRARLSITDSDVARTREWTAARCIYLWEKFDCFHHAKASVRTSGITNIMNTQPRPPTSPTQYSFRYHCIVTMYMCRDGLMNETGEAIISPIPNLHLIMPSMRTAKTMQSVKILMRTFTKTNRFARTWAARLSSRRRTNGLSVNITEEVDKTYKAVGTAK